MRRKPAAAVPGIPTDHVFFAPALTARERRSAAWNGRRDGTRGIPLVLPEHLRGSLATAAEPAPAWTPYIEGAHLKATAASTRLAAVLLETHRDTIVALYRRAEVVVREHDHQRSLSDAARGRFILSLNHWRVTATACRPWAETAATHANLLIAEYWKALTRSYLRWFPLDRRHPERRDAERRAAMQLAPAWAQTDPVWTKPDALLLLSFPKDDASSAQAARTLQHALCIIDPSGLESDS
jgi:hypothetical protein